MIMQIKQTLPLPLRATASNWRLFMLRKADKGFAGFANKVFARDNHTCQYCGFQAQAALDVVNLDGNFHNNKLGNLVTACPLCSQCFFLESVGMGEFGGGQLIYCPQMSQVELNGLCHVLFASIANNTSFASEAKNIYRSLKLCTQQVEKEFGEGLSSPNIFGCLYIESQADQKQAFANVLNQNIRLLPSLAKFTTQIKEWTREGLKQLA